MIASFGTVRESPLLPMQRGLLFHSLAGGDDAAAYVCQTIAAVDGAVDREALRRAWAYVIARHDVLRTAFRWEGLDEPVQGIAADVSFEIVEHDWTADEATAQRRLDAYLAADRRQPFDLAAAPIMRFALLRVAPDRAWLVWTYHHALIDGRSRLLVLNEVAACYDAIAQGRALHLAPAPSFHDYVVWQRARPQDAARAYWTDALHDLSSTSVMAHVLGGDAERVAGEPYGQCEVPVSPDLERAIRRVARRRRVTPNLVVQAAWSILLSRYGHTRDVVFGETRACRREAFPEMHALVGLVINTIPIRVRLGAASTATGVLEALRAAHVALRAHEAASLADIRTWIGADHSADLFDTLVVFEETALDAAIGRDTGLWRGGVRRTGAAHYRLTLVGYNKPALSLALAFDRRAVSEAAVARVGRHLATLLAAIASDPEQRVGELPLLDAEERAQRLTVGRGAGAPASVRRSVPQLFAAQAAQTPTATALVGADETLSYAELESRANRLARALRRRGVRVGTRVAMALERSVDAIVAMLAIVKSGGVYVPLDPSLPASRRAWLLHDASVRVGIAVDPAARACDESAVMWLTAAAGAAESDTPLTDVAVPPHASAYVMYTSGSTGTPKGVEVSHAGIVRLVVDADYVTLGPGETLLQLAPLGFDASTFEIWGALLRGGRLVLYPGATPDLAQLGALIAREHVSCLWLTASLFNLIVDSAPATLAGVRQILTGGEALSAPHVRRAQALLPETTFINGYGPTEATTFACCHRIARDLAAEAASIPIGRPIAGTDVVVLDADGALTPIGVAGELHLGGVGLAHGYVGRPALTAGAFVPHPSGAAGERVYATGDWVRWRADGVLEFLGRRDAQVKIRGFRVEPGEVEAAVRQLPDVADAAVVVRRSASAGPQLVAYVAARMADADASTIGVRVRADLAERLPEYMVPAAIVVLDRLPLMANGKVDRRHLPEPAHASDEDATAPHSALEAIVAATLGELLGRTTLGPDADFFAHGGHSLLAMRAASLLRTRLAVEVPVRWLFDAPTPRQLAARLEATGGVGVSVLPMVPREARLPLSFAQERLRFLQELEGGCQYNVPLALRLHGPLDIAALRTALTELVARHEVLRTRLVDVDGEATQQIDPPSPVAMPVIAVDTGSDSARAAVVQRLLTAEARQPFALASESMLRLRLLRLGPTEHVLALTMHHAACDMWSFDVLAADLAALYASVLDGRPASLAPLPVQYADYALRQRAWTRESPAAAAQMAYWQTALAGAPRLDLPARPTVSSARPDAGGQHVFAVPAAVMDAATALSRRERATVFMTLLAAWQVLLARYTGQTDVVVGTPISGRLREELEGVVGLFLNTLALRTDLGGRPSFRAVVERARAVALGGYAHQGVPFEHVVDALHPLREGSRSPLFDVMFVVQGQPRNTWALRDVAVTVEEGDTGAAKFDLTLTVREREGDWQAVLTYRTARFDAAQIAAMATHWVQLLTAAVADPDRRIGELPLLTAEERAQRLTAGRGAGAPASVRRSVPQVFAAQASQTPGATALVGAEETLSYAELESRANRLARALRRRGVRVGTRVAMALERSVDAVVAMLAIVKAGGVYVPLDPNVPAERFTWLLRDAGVRVGIAETPTTNGSDDIVWLRGDAGIDESDAPLAGVVVPPNASAYVMYTSGSTGTPKGVEVSHAGIVRLVVDADYVTLGPAETLLQLAPLGFDASTFEIWGALLRGGRLVLYPGATPDLAQLGAVIAREHVSCLWLTASLFNLIVDSAPATLAGVRQILTGGEALSAPHVRRAQALLPETTFINGYGPTEATTFACCHRIARDLAAEAASIPIGRPIAGTDVVVLDADGALTPIGVAGELHLGGVGLAHGYVGRPALTAGAFVPHPSGAAGERVYATGDWVRWRADGVLEFLGRRDAQVKIRGFRVEPGEVEAAVRQLPDVADAAVVVRHATAASASTGEGKQLVAYVAPRETTNTDAATFGARVRQELAARLPEYMVPAAVVVLARLPLTANGKVDRQQLPAPAWTLEGDGQAPRTAIETIVAVTLGELVGRAALGPDEDFFAHGGHSLLAMRAASLLRTRLAVEVPVRLLFDAPTPRQLAARLEAERAAAPPIPAAPRSRRLPLSFAQERLRFLQELDGGSQYNVPFALRLHGPLDVAALRSALTGLVARHEVLRTRLVDVDGRAVQRIAAPATVPLPVIALDGAPAAVVARLLTAEARRPFALAREPMLRVRLLQLGPAEHVLALTMHHAACDLWSCEVLATDLASLYAAAVERRTAALAPRPVQYADYAVWQRAWMRESSAAAAQMTYWRSALASAPRLALPVRATSATSSRRDAGGAYLFAVPAAVMRAVTALSRREGVTVFMTLLASWQALLARYTGQTDIVVGTPISGRIRAELEDVVGLFLNTLALRTDLSGAPSFRALLARVRAVALAGYAHQDVPFEQVVEAVQPLREGSRSPLFDVMFVVQGARTPWRLRDLVVTVDEGDIGAAKFDLTLTVRELSDDWLGTVSYRTARFDAAQMAAMAAHWVQLLTAAVADPDQRIADLPLLAPDEHAQLLAAGRVVAPRASVTASVHALVEAQAAVRGGDRAVVCGEASLTYAALDARANRLARALRARGVGPDVRIAVCLERGIDLVVALLAVLKSGGAYVPLDPALPPKRLAYLLSDSAAALVLTSTRLSDDVPLAGSAVVRLDTLDAELAALPASGLTSRTSPLHAAYVIYTSGSTGQPKGVVVTHGNVVSFLASMASAPGLDPSDVLLSVTTPSFDIAGLEMFLPLSTGATVAIAGDDAVRDPRELIPLLAGSGATMMQATPTTWRMLLEAGWGGSPQLTALIGGELLTRSLADALAGTVGRLWNMYGPTETTIWSCMQRIVAGGDVVPIGRPIDNTTVYVLDAHMQLTPPGVAGELCIGGDGVARGYWQRPRLTAERFVPDPLSREPGARMYRTGDLVRWLPDGALEFIGRIDRQVKIRGHRVELEEIEAVIAQHAEVSAAAVVLRTDASGEPRLVAYYVAAGGVALDRELKRHVRERVPAYMMPAVFVHVPSMPLTANGKLDRRALPSPGTVDAASDDAAPIAPSTELERMLATLWAEALGVTRVSADANFFELGGHSLLALDVISRVGDALEMDVPLRALFDTPSLMACAAAIAAQDDHPESLERRAARFNALAGGSADAADAASADLAGETLRT